MLPRPVDRSVIIARGIVGASLVAFGVSKAVEGKLNAVWTIPGLALLWVALADTMAAIDSVKGRG